MAGIPNFPIGGATFTDGAVSAAAAKLSCELAAVRAVMDVESRGGFQADKRPKILFERHVFSRLTSGKFDRKNPKVSSPVAGGYVGGPGEYLRMEEACKLDVDAGLSSASWGAFQIMGYHWKSLGYESVRDFVGKMFKSEDEHLAAFVAFVKKNGLADELRANDWRAFARGYNGPAFETYKYDQKLAAAYATHTLGIGARTDSPRPTLQMGASGTAVAVLQTALGIEPDGDFGPATKKKVIAFQRAQGLTADGVVGPATWSKLAV